ncbi:alpha-1,4-L-rhamnosidase [Formosa sp. 3Alg 14/1]|uniref:alpha-1,4-L-rhamnosidase n=1 Tax=Formosa sp. 3Alg 14/1 TaxID=3382190 RepID=UPI0039BEA5AC
MKNKKGLCHILKYIITCLLFGVIFINPIQAQIVLQTDFTDSENARQNIDYHFNVFNRITPLNGVKIKTPLGKPRVCIVRPLGGIVKNGKPDISKDSYKWDKKSKTFYTDFTVLKNQMDGVFNSGYAIHQIVLDNPSWAFQRNKNGELVADSLKVSTYGNAEPPKDYNAWSNYLKDVLKFLVNTYGEESMLKIQFNIGREIGTPSHWSGTKEAFFEFYKISSSAIREVLPTAKVGTHFLWGSSKNAWGTDFVKWSKANNVHYDFIGVSFYPFYNKPDRTLFKEVYAKDFAVIKDIPEWHKNAKLEMHEYALIKSLNKAGNAFENAPKAQQNSFIVGLMKMFYEHNMQNVFQWGQGTNFEAAQESLFSIQGQTYYTSTKNGKPLLETNDVDAIFIKDVYNNIYNIMAYNYNANPNATTDEHLNLKAKLDVPPGTKVKVRFALYNKEKDTMSWSEWIEEATQGNEKSKSVISLNAELPVFSFLKYEVKVQ